MQTLCYVDCFLGFVVKEFYLISISFTRCQEELENILVYVAFPSYPLLLNNIKWDPGRQRLDLNVKIVSIFFIKTFKNGFWLYKFYKPQPWCSFHLSPLVGELRFSYDSLWDHSVTETPDDASLSCSPANAALLLSASEWLHLSKAHHLALLAVQC